MRTRSLKVVVALVAAGIGGALARAEEKDPLAPGSDFASDGAIAASIKDGEKTLAVAIARNVTAVLDLGAKFKVRVDRQVRRGPSLQSLFQPGQRVVALGRLTAALDARGQEIGAPRIAPYHALVLGEGFDPKTVLAAAREKFGEKVRWFLATVDHLEPPDTIWVNDTEEKKKVYAINVGRDDHVLTTAVHESTALLSGDLRAALTKGRPVRFRGKISTVLYTDSKGRLVEESERRKRGVRAEVHVVPAGFVLLDPTRGYGTIETAEGS